MTRQCGVNLRHGTPWLLNVDSRLCAFRFLAVNSQFCMFRLVDACLRHGLIGLPLVSLRFCDFGQFHILTGFFTSRLGGVPLWRRLLRFSSVGS